jgi:4-hydroxy-2-oxoheptanedioate aldolase
MKDVFAAMDAGEVVVGHWVSSGSPTMVELIGHSGADIVAIDCEHGAISPYGSELENCVRAAYAADIAPIVRVPSHDGVQISKAADYGAKGVIVPHVNTPEQLADCIAHIKFPPVGNRGCYGSVPAARLTFTPWQEYADETNATVEIIPLFEEPRAFEALDELVAVEGLRAVAMGPLDLAARVGGVGTPEAIRKVAGYLDQMLEACLPRGIHVIDGAWDLDTFKARVDAGCKGIMYSGDVPLLAGALRQHMGPIREHLAGR